MRWFREFRSSFSSLFELDFDSLLLSLEQPLSLSLCLSPSFPTILVPHFHSLSLLIPPQDDNQEAHHLFHNNRQFHSLLLSANFPLPSLLKRFLLPLIPRSAHPMCPYPPLRPHRSYPTTHLVWIYRRETSNQERRFEFREGRDKKREE